MNRNKHMEGGQDKMQKFLKETCGLSVFQHQESGVCFLLLLCLFNNIADAQDVLVYTLLQFSLG